MPAGPAVPDEFPEAGGRKGLRRHNLLRHYKHRYHPCLGVCEQEGGAALPQAANPSSILMGTKVAFGGS